MNKTEKQMRKAWKKQAQKMANHDLEGLIAMQKITALTIRRLKTQKTVLIIALCVAIAAGVVGWVV